jgi:hypothetical protein
MEKHELSKIDFDIIEDAFKALLHSRPGPVTADKIADRATSFTTPSPVGWRSKRPRKANGMNCAWARLLAALNTRSGFLGDALDPNIGYVDKPDGVLVAVVAIFVYISPNSLAR